jgi:CheY-like chemotaxis protein
MPAKEHQFFRKSRGLIRISDTFNGELQLPKCILQNVLFYFGAIRSPDKHKMRGLTGRFFFQINRHATCRSFPNFEEISITRNGIAHLRHFAPCRRTRRPSGSGSSDCLWLNGIMKRIVILLADDNGAERSGLRKILELEYDLEVIGEAKDGCQAVGMVNKLRPALVLMDVAMPLFNGLQATSRILNADPAAKVLIFSAHSDDAYIVEAINSGATGYLMKQTAADSVCSAIRKVRKRNTFSGRSIPGRLNKGNKKNR